MDKETYEALKRIIRGKEGSQKNRLSHLYENTKDFRKLENWLEEVAKDY